MELICELATGHGGDLDVAKRMIDAAAQAGAHTVKTQAYLPTSVNPTDPQASWLKQAALSPKAHHALQHHASSQGLHYFASVFDRESRDDILHICGRFKVPATEAAKAWWYMDTPVVLGHNSAVVSWLFGQRQLGVRAATHLTAIPLYPTPLEIITSATVLDGWSDHCVGLAGCLYALAHGATTLEVHLTIPGAREMPWDKTPAQVKDLRRWMDDFTTIQTGVSQTFRQRWLR